MKRIPLKRLASLALAIMPLLAKAQSPVIDSLKNELNNPSLHDSTRAEIHSKLATRLVSFNAQLAVEHGNKAVDLALRSGNRVMTGRAYGTLGFAYKNAGELDKAMQAIKAGIRYLEDNPDSFRLGNLYFYLASVYNRIPDYKSATFYYLEALKIYEKNEKSDPRAALNIGLTHNHIGSVYYLQKDYTSALHYYRMALQRWNNSAVYINIANIYESQAKYDSASIIYRKGAAMALSRQEYPTYIIALENIGAVFRKTGNFDSAEYHLRKALFIADTIGNAVTVFYGHNELARLYLDKKQYSKAIDHASRVLELDPGMGENDERMNAFLLLSKAHQALGDYRKAHQYLQEHVTLKDSIFTKSNQESISTMQRSYELERRQNEIERLAQANELNKVKLSRESTIRNFLIAVILLLVLSVALVIHNLMTKAQLITKLSRQSKEIMLQNNQIKSMNHILELKTLRAQINPHFLFNALSSIQNYVIKSEKDVAIDYLQKFARLIRKVLDSSMVPSITLKEEADMLNNYIELERLRFGFNFDYEIIMPADVDPATITIPYLVVQPYVENSILHGLRLKEGKGFLRIEFRNEGERVLCIVDDNGIGRAASRERKTAGPKHKSVGITLTEDRIRKIGEFTNEKLDVQIIDKEESGMATGTRVEIHIPYMALEGYELYQ